jgi:hypothetical protein
VDGQSDEIRAEHLCESNDRCDYVVGLPCQTFYSLRIWMEVSRFFIEKLLLAAVSHGIIREYWVKLSYKTTDVTGNAWYVATVC